MLMVYSVVVCLSIDVNGIFSCQIVEKDCRARGLNREDAMDRARWRKLIGIIDENSG